MPITITNQTAGDIILSDLGITVPASGTFVVARTNYWQDRIGRSPSFKTEFKAGNITVAIDSSDAVNDTYDSELASGFKTSGNMYVTTKARKPMVLTYSGQTVNKPANPDDGDFGFSPLHRVEFYKDATRNKWLSVAIFDMFFCKAGATAVDDYLCLQGISPGLGANFPLSLCFVTSMIQTNVSGTAHQTDFALMKNGVEDLVIPIANGNYNEANLSLNHSVAPVATTEEGYRIKVKAVEASGTPPIDPLIVMAYRLELL